MARISTKKERIERIKKICKLSLRTEEALSVAQGLGNAFRREALFCWFENR